MKNEVRDSSGNLLYWTQKVGFNQIEVYDAKGHSLGYCVDGKTMDAQGNIVAYGETPGILYKGN